MHADLTPYAGETVKLQFRYWTDGAAVGWADGTLMRPRLQSYDATFGLTPTDALTVHKNSVARTVPSQPGVDVFDDMNSYWSLTDQHGQHGNDSAGDHYRVGWNSVANPHSGTSIRVKSPTPGGSCRSRSLSRSSPIATRTWTGGLLARPRHSPGQ